MDFSPLWISLKTAFLATIITSIIGIFISYKMANYKGRGREMCIRDRVRVTGRVSSKFGNAQIKLQDENYDLQIIDERINLILPIEFSTFDSMQEKNEGMLVKTIGKVTSIAVSYTHLDVYKRQGKG